MTVQEAKGFIQGKLDCMNKCDVFECKGTDECENCNYCYSQGNFGEQKEAFKFAIECLEELEQYRALGTVEELKEAMEKQIPKSPTIEGDGYCPDGNLVYDTWYCPNCDKSYEIDYDEYDYCPKCGQAIDRAIFY